MRQEETSATTSDSPPEAQPAMRDGLAAGASRVVVVGGGITGLAAALLLSGSGRSVTVLERDAESEAGDPDEAFEHWRCKGVAQIRHSHAFLGRQIGRAHV